MVGGSNPEPPQPPNPPAVSLENKTYRRRYGMLAIHSQALSKEGTDNYFGTRTWWNLDKRFSPSDLDSFYGHTDNYADIANAQLIPQCYRGFISDDYSTNKKLSVYEYLFIPVPGYSADYYYLHEELREEDKHLGLVPWWHDKIFAVVLPKPEVYARPLDYTKVNAPLQGFRLAVLS